MSARGLRPNELRALVAEYGSLEAARHARPEIADFIEAGTRAFRQINEAIKTGLPRLRVVQEPELAPVGPIQVELAPNQPAPAVNKTHQAGAPDRLYPRDEIVRVLRAWRGRYDTPQKVSARSLARPGFSRTAVRRVIRLDENGAFQLGPRGGLKWHGIDGEFRAARKLVSLRALEEALGLGSLG